MRGDTSREDQRQALTLVEGLCERYGAELSSDELETLANALLRSHGPDEHYPHLADETVAAGGRGFVIHSLEDESSPRSRAARDRPAQPPENLPGALLERVARLLTAAKLKGRRRRVARLRLLSYAPAEVARLLKLKREVVYLEWRYAKRALGLKLSSLDYDRGAGITRADARKLFRTEQCKRAYRKPGHCARGKEKCRRTGVCRFRGE